MPGKPWRIVGSEPMRERNRWAISWLAQCLSSVRVSASGPAASGAVKGLCTDSRQLEPGQAFIALRGEVFDGHAFIEQAIKTGVAAVVAEQWPSHLDAQWAAGRARDLAMPLPAVMLVPNTRRAYGEFAKAWRRRFDLPVAAVTGSNGKTTVKEMMGAIVRAHLGADPVLVSRGNLNNDIGVPQMVLELNHVHKAAVLELGMNHPGEIAWLAQIAQPTVALVTNAQREHQEFMGSVEATAHENACTFDELPAHGVAVFPGDEEFTSLWATRAGGRRCMRFGWAQSAEHATRLQLDLWAQADTPAFELQTGAGSIPVQLQLLGAHNRRNALAAACAAMALGCSMQAIVQGLAAMRPVKGRLVETPWQDKRLIDDTYNANPDSVRAAIDVLASRSSQGQTVLVLGDMGEVGERSTEFHAEVGAYAAEQGINVLLGIGAATRHAVDAANRLAAAAPGPMARWFDSPEALVQAVAAHAQAGSTILVKGSRFMRMERIVQVLLSQTEAHAEVGHAA
jgi:UDP-N-acetylmuramoyl-tripeptide--D-alanyl-D-alanine ligase